MKKVIKINESDLQHIVKRVLNEGWFNSNKKKIKSFQDYEDYRDGIDTTIVVYEEGENYLINVQGEMGRQVTLHTLPKEKFSEEQAIAIGLDISGEDNFPNKRRMNHINEQRDYIKRKLKDILRPPKCEECGEYEEEMYSDYGLEPEPTNVCTNKECSKSDWYYGRHLKEEIKKDIPSEKEYIQSLKDIRSLIPVIAHNIIHNKGLEHNSETIISLNKHLFQKVKEGDDTILDELWEIAGTMVMKNAINIITLYPKG